MEMFEEWNLHTNFDERGYLRKIYMDSFQSSFATGIKEVFVSQSKKGTVRGMHLVTGINGGYKFIHVVAGKVYDVLFDLRKSSKSFGKSKINVLSSNQPKTLWVPPGVAHGFQALSECQIIYGSTTEWDQNLDGGFNPLEIVWPNEISFISERDLGLPKLNEFDYEEVSRE